MWFKTSVANVALPRSSGSKWPRGRLERGTIVGAGGGKVLDTARAVSADLNLPVVSCPTVASSDAPCSALSVIYTEEGTFQEYRFYRKNPDLVLVDTQVIAQAPPRLLSAGMGDALATWFEARTCVAGSVRNMRGGGSTASALALAELCYRTLLADGPAALHAVSAQAVTPALERLVEANTLLSGLGFESSGLAAAHAVHNGLTAVQDTHAYFHGEKVAFGLLVQLVLEGASQATFDEVLGFSSQVGLPITLADIGLLERRATSSTQLPVVPPYQAKPSTMSPLRSRPTSSPMQCSPLMHWGETGKDFRNQGRADGHRSGPPGCHLDQVAAMLGEGGADVAR